MKKSYQSFIVLFVLGGFLNYGLAQSQRLLSNPNASPEAKALYCYINSTFGKKILSGQMWASWGVDELNYTQTHTGKLPAIRGMDYMSSNENNAETQRAIDWWKRGGIPTIMWHWGAPSKGEGYENSKVKIDINKCFEPGTAEYKDFWLQLKLKADQLEKLRDANVPVLWRPFHELNGGWFWWGMGGSEQFKKLWTTMYDYYVKERGLNNLIWVLCYTGEPNGNWFPGNQYVDIAGADTYTSNSGPQTAMYNRVKNSIGGNSMPITFHECGIPPNPDQCLSEGSMWSWWMEWHTSWLEGVDKTYLKWIYNHDLVITLDELPDIMSVCGSSTCTATVIEPYIQLNGGTWTQQTAAQTCVEGSVNFGPHPVETTGWTWTGPNNFKATTREVALTNITEQQGGTYTATYTNPGGCKSTQNIVVTVAPGTVISPYSQVNSGSWLPVANVELCQGGVVNFGPHPYEIETGWSWKGPNNFTATTREISFDNLKPSQAGTYTATFTNAAKCTTTANMVVAVNESPTIKITNPLENEVITTDPATITITTTTVGKDITTVQFYNGNTLLGQATTAPYQYVWNNVLDGNYTITARATDVKNCVGNSAPVSMEVSKVTGFEKDNYLTKADYFPNPFQDHMTVNKIGNFDYSVYTSSGQVIEKGNANNSVEIGKQLKTGLYLLVINSGDKTETIKITKQ